MPQCLKCLGVKPLVTCVCGLGRCEEEEQEEEEEGEIKGGE